MNKNPVKARLARRKKSRKAGDLAQMRLKMWRAAESAEAVLYASDDAPTILRAVHALTQAGSAYCKVVEVGELEARLTELERQYEQPMRRVV